MDQSNRSFEDVRGRLEQIVDEVNAEGVTLDEALKLYEEAVKLGLSACELSESDLLPEEMQPEAAADGQPEGDAVQPPQPDPAIPATYEASDIAEAALIEQVGDAASVQRPQTPDQAAPVEAEDDGPAPYSR